ncbi:type II toxin-antitoxin system RelE/ParE family toxin [[Clostridium] innocuum]|nr:type II toxin-antitoxin system RelE/ParE family toxin [[Clostridium] innocuum]
MQKNKLVYSPEAMNDLDEIWEYIYLETLDNQISNKTINKILDTVDTLKDFSEIGAKLSGITNIKCDYRFLVVGKYLVFYRTIQETVYIDRVLSSRQSYLKILFSQ